MFEGMDMSSFGDYYSYGDDSDSSTDSVSDFNFDDFNFADYEGSAEEPTTTTSTTTTTTTTVNII